VATTGEISLMRNVMMVIWPLETDVTKTVRSRAQVSVAMDFSSLEMMNSAMETSVIKMGATLFVS
jgi:hypothetical protein